MRRGFQKNATMNLPEGLLYPLGAFLNYFILNRQGFKFKMTPFAIHLYKERIK